jgi:hypothetical protein
MKRRLRDKLVLLVKADRNVISPAAAAAAVPGSSATSSSSRKGSSSWTFPHTAHQEGETMRAAAERALRETVGLSQVRGCNLALVLGLREWWLKDFGGSRGCVSNSLMALPIEAHAITYPLLAWQSTDCHVLTSQRWSCVTRVTGTQYWHCTMHVILSFEFR